MLRINISGKIMWLSIKSKEKKIKKIKNRKNQKEKEINFRKNQKIKIVVFFRGKLIWLQISITATIQSNLNLRL